MKYAKLENGRIQYAPNPILIDGNVVGNPGAEVYVGLGYKPVEYVEPPQEPEGYGVAMSWMETDSAIVQAWTLVEMPVEDPTSDELLEIILGVDDE